MILVTMGTQKLQCDRIINTILNSDIDEEIVIQGYYFPTKKYTNVQFKEFVGYDEMNEFLDKSSIVIASGTGSIFRALSKGKKVIIFPRLGKYGEAVDNHGLDMKILKKEGYTEFVEDANDFKKIYEITKKKEFKKFVSNTNNFINKLEKELKKL